jgi:hypothetical protein
MEKVFTNIYEQSVWGNDHHPAYKGSSGSGSSVLYNKDKYIPFLKNFILEHNIQRLVDLGCGDFRCGTLLYDDLDIVYTGYDVYSKVIEYNSKQHSAPKYNFIHLDFFTQKEQIQCGDLCILKDVLQHWSNENIHTFLDYLVDCKKFQYILICNCCNQIQDNLDIPDGRTRQLSCDLLPLKKYDPIRVLRYNTKEVSLIELIKIQDPVENLTSN